MATTFAYEVSGYRRKDGTYLIKIRMIHNREVVRKPSSIYVKREQLSRDLSKVKDVAVLESINIQLNKLRRIVASIDNAEFMSAEKLWSSIIGRMMSNGGFELDFFDYARRAMSTMERGTAAGYKTSLSAFRRFLKNDKIDINDITYKMLVDFRNFLETEPALKDGKGKYGEKSKGCRAVSYYMSCLRHIHNLARAEYNDDDIDLVRIPRQPFKAGLIPKQPLTEHRSLTVEQIRKIASVALDNDLALFSRDVFVLSFVLLGMNTADLYNVDKKCLNNGVLTYNRAKTDSVRQDNAMIQVRIEQEAIPLLERYRGSVKLFSFCERYSDIKGFNKAVNKGLKRVGEAVDIDGLTTYHARHSWATIARNECGIPRDLVGEGLNHAESGGGRVTDIYIKRDFSRIWEANRKVLDYVFGSAK